MPRHSPVPWEGSKMPAKRGFRSPRATARRLVASIVIGGLAVGILHITPAAADLQFTLDADGCSGGCGSVGIPPFGTVLLHQVVADTVRVTETLVPGVEFIRTGAGDSIVFDTKAGTTLSAITSGFTKDVSLTPIHVGSLGNFNFGIVCSGCGPGASSPLPGSLSFTAGNPASLLLTDLVANSGGYFFAADIINPNVMTRRPTGIAGTRGPVVRYQSLPP
jgi:hypothetical protein